MVADLSILYRGPLASCNYDCHYCPFAKQRDTAAELRADRKALARFVDWVSNRTDRTFAVFFTPWGEALVRRWYRDAIATLSHESQVQKVAVQTNLSCRLDWLDECDVSRLGFWCTYHPSQIARRRFVRSCLSLDARGVNCSAGMVAVKENFDEIAAMRRELPPSIYLWLNAYKREEQYYSEQELEWLSSIDPHFRTNNTYHTSIGRRCRTGRSVISVDGDGTARRCHFIESPIGNIYDERLEEFLGDRLCTKERCGCHIGYVHLEHLGQEAIYGAGILERVPQS